MCNPLPGLRCYPDSKKKLTRIDVNIAASENLSDELLKEMGTVDPSTVAGLQRYEECRELRAKNEEHLKELRRDRIHTLRDVDSTKQGREELLEALKNVTSTSEEHALSVRLATSDSIRFNREHAVQLKKSGRAAPIHFKIFNAKAA